MWRTNRDEIPAWSTPVIYQGKTRTELVTSGSKYYRGYDPLSGSELWRLRDDTQVKVPSPVVANDLFSSERRQSARPRFLRGAARLRRATSHWGPGRKGSAARGVAEDARQSVYADADRV